MYKVFAEVWCLCECFYKAHAWVNAHPPICRYFQSNRPGRLREWIRYYTCVTFAQTSFAQISH